MSVQRRIRFLVLLLPGVKIHRLACNVKSRVSK